MTNAEKYKEVFGFFPDFGNCPADDCMECPCVAKNSMNEIQCLSSWPQTWWKKEYKEINI